MTSIFPSVILEVQLHSGSTVILWKYGHTLEVQLFCGVTSSAMVRAGCQIEREIYIERDNRLPVQLAVQTLVSDASDCIWPCRPRQKYKCMSSGLLSSQEDFLLLNWVTALYIKTNLQIFLGRKADYCVFVGPACRSTFKIAL